jgi:hypothetical protein
MSFLGGDTLHEAIEGNPRLGVTDFIKLVIAPGTPINTSLLIEFIHITLYL